MKAVLLVTDKLGVQNLSRRKICSLRAYHIIQQPLNEHRQVLRFVQRIILSVLGGSHCEYRSRLELVLEVK
jgi:hypothetical protein